VDLLKMQDLMEILYILNRIKYDSYDDDDVNEIKNMSEIDRTENMIRILCKNSDKTTKGNADHVINLMRDMDSVNRDMCHTDNRHDYDGCCKKSRDNCCNEKTRDDCCCKKTRHNYSHGHQDQNCNCFNGIVNKILFFLNSLNEGE